MIRRFFVLAFILVVSSCSKSEIGKNEGFEAESSSNISLVNGSQTGFNVASLLNNQVETDLYSAISSNNQILAQSVINDMADDFALHYSSNYGLDLNSEFNNDKSLIVLFALIEEARNRYLDPSSSSSGNLSCFFTAVAGIMGIKDARSIWASIVSGSYNTGTVIDAIKLFGGRIGGVISVAFAIYQVGECFGWWNALPVENENDVNINSIPIEFFTSQTFRDLHYTNLLNYIINLGHDSYYANYIIETVIGNYGDSIFRGTNLVENYFESLN